MADDPVAEPLPGESSPPFDAPLEEKVQLVARMSGVPVDDGFPPEFSPSTRAVHRPGEAATNAVGPRAPVRGKQNWIPTGPRNVGGRIRAVIVSPRDPNVLWAGAAAGGVFKTEDRGETWFPLWHEQAALAIGALAVCAPADGQPETVWAATGEVNYEGGQGIFRSDNAGADWTNPAVQPVPGSAANRGTAFEAIAAHPTNRARAFAVGPAGVFRTMDSGRTWIQFADGVYYSDVAYSANPDTTTVGAPPLILYLVRAQSVAGEAVVVRINPDEPSDANVRAAIALPANAITVIPAVVAPNPIPPPENRPARGKIAVCPATPGVVYVRYTTGGSAHLNIFRLRIDNAGVVTQATLPPHGDWVSEGQGDYNLSLAVNPHNANHLATGMTGFYLSQNANADPVAGVVFLRAMAWELYSIDRAHHADHHVALFVGQTSDPGAPANTPELWIANDGGISRSLDWWRPAAVSYANSGTSTLPLPAGAITWRKRSHGITAVMMYSLSQSPLVPSIFGCGLQDNGVYVTTGGLSWYWVLDGDGGFVAFDPDDPFKLIANWQTAIHEILFPGRPQVRPAPGDMLNETAWPRPLRQGFLPTDGGVFAGKAVHHPRHGDRVLHARKNRLYGSRGATGDTWTALPVGRGFELLWDGGLATATLEVLPSAAARRLGLAPQIATGRASTDLFAPRTSTPARVRSSLPGPYALVAGETLDVQLDGALRNIPITAAAAADLGNATPAEVAAFLDGAAVGLTVRTCLWPRPSSVELTTRGIGADAAITLGGNALDPLPGAAFGRLSVRPGTYHGEADRQASVTLPAGDLDLSPIAGTDRELTIKIGPGGSTRHVTFSAGRFANPASVRAGELETAIREALGSDAATATATSFFKLLRLTWTGAAGTGVVSGGTAVARLGLPPPPVAPAGPPAVVFVVPPVQAVLDLSVVAPAPALTLTIGDGVNTTAAITFSLPSAAVDVSDLRSITVEELRRILDRRLRAAGVAVSCEVMLFPAASHATEIAYAPGEPDVVWVGGLDGTVYRSRNDGDRWDTIVDPRLRAQGRPVNAIAVDPRDARRVYVGLEGTANGDRTRDPGFLFRSEDDGGSWTRLGEEMRDGDKLAGINALEIDPDDADTLYAATNVGVFRSTNKGGGWEAFSEGLPNGIMRDLDFVPATRTLRVGVWGRATFERHVGDRPAQDVRLYARANLLDDGSTRPAPRGPRATGSTPAGEPATESPDIKVNRVRPAGIGADELIDGVEFDEDIAHEEPTPGHANVFVQAHNRGSFTATRLRVVALWADASVSLPPLPADFWARFAAGTLVEPLGDWHLVGDAVVPDGGRGHDRVAPGYPRVHHFELDWPAALDGMGRMAILALVSSPEDTLHAAALDVTELLAHEPKAALRVTRTTPQAFDRTLYLRRTGATQFSIAAPAAPAVSALAALGLAAVGPVDDAFGGIEPVGGFVLPPLGGGPGTEPAVAFSVVRTVNISLAAAEFPNLANVLARELITLLNRELLRAGVPVRAGGGIFGAPPPPPQQAGIGLTSRGNATFTIAGAAQATLGLPAGPVAAGATVFSGAPEPFNFTAGAPQVLTLTVTNPMNVVFQPGNATARQVRETFNLALSSAVMPVEAVVPRVDLWVRRSVTDVDGVPATVGGRQLADLAVEPAAVAIGEPRRQLFDLMRVYRDDQVRANVNNFLYLRSTNFGVAPQPNARHRLFQLTIGATPIGRNQIGGNVLERIPAGGFAIVEFTWNPGAVAAGDRLFVLAVVDHDSDGRRLDPPADFATVEVLDAFCDTHAGAAYREFAVAP